MAAANKSAPMYVLMGCGPWKLRVDVCGTSENSKVKNMKLLKENNYSAKMMTSRIVMMCA